MDFLLRHLLTAHFSLVLPSYSISCSLPFSLLAVCSWEEESVPTRGIKTGVCRQQRSFTGSIKCGHDNVTMSFVTVSVLSSLLHPRTVHSWNVPDSKSFPKLSNCFPPSGTFNFH